MSNFVTPLKINIESKVKSCEKDKTKGALQSSVYNITKAFTEINNVLKSVILFSVKK